MTPKEDQAAMAMSEIMGLVLVAISRATPDVPTALSLFNHTAQACRDSLKRNWDDLRRPEFSKNFEAGLNSLVTTMKRIHAETVG